MRDESQSVVRTRFATRDFDEAREALERTYGDHVTRLRGAEERFAFETSSVDLDAFALDELFYGSLVQNDYRAPDDMLVLGTLRRGAFAVDDGEHEHVPAAEEMVWFRPGRPQRIRAEDVTIELARIDLSALARVAGEISGLEPEELRFLPGPPASDQRARYWDSTRRWIADHVLADDGLAAEPLIRAEAFRALARATLLTVPNTALTRLTDRTGPAAGRGAEPATVRRAVEFVDAHARGAIDITQIAEAARIGPRGLQAAFRRHRGQTPLEYLRQVRMDGAHHELLDADPTRGDTVAGIAARWGFTHPGRFSVDYRRAHGRSPSETLRA